MATLRCPHCGSPMGSERTWAPVAVSTLMAAAVVAWAVVEPFLR